MRHYPLPNILLLAALTALIFFLSDYIVWFGDPIIYGFSFADGKPIDSAADIFTSQYAHYMKYNGRVWAHVLCQAFSGIWGQRVFALCNAGVYVVFVLLLARIAGMHRRRLPELLLCVLTTLFFTDTAYHPNCQIGYVWTSAVTLGFIIAYFRCRREEHPRALTLAALFVLSALAGNGNEAIAIGTGAALAVDFCMNFRRLTKAQIVMLAGFGIGGLILCLSPGILGRASSNYGNTAWSTFRLLCYSRMLYVMIITLAVLKLRRKIRLKTFARDNIFYISAWAALLLFNYMIGITWLSARQLFGVELFSAILTLRALRGVKVGIWILGLAAMMVGGMYWMKFDCLRTSNTDLEQLRQEVTHTDDHTIFMDFHHYGPFVHPSELINDYGMRKYAAYSFHNQMLGYGHFIVDPGYTDFRIYPTAMKQAIEAPDHNFAHKGADGMYLVVQDSHNPRRFMLHRHYDIPGLSLEKEPYEIKFDGHMQLDLDGMRVVYSTFYTPLIANDEITIE